MAGMRFAKVAALGAVGSLALWMAVPAMAAGDTLVTNGSPTTPFSQNKQNEPALAVDAHSPNVMVAGGQRRDRYGSLQLRRRQ